MFNPSYLSLSRHHIYYFRWPIPAAQNARSSYVHLSLGTREPKEALRLARSMASLGEFLIALNPALLIMDHKQRKDIIQSTFSEALKRFKFSVDKFGPRSGEHLTLLTQSGEIASQAVKDKDDFWFPEIHKQITAIIEARGIADTVTDEDMESLKFLFIEGTKSYYQEALQYNFDAQAISLADNPYPLPVVSVQPKHHYPLGETIKEYLEEKSKTNSWGIPTKNARTAQLKLLTEFLGEDYNLCDLDFATARKVKDKLGKIPKNYKKKSSEVLSELSPSDTLSVKTFNDYMTTYSSFAQWAKNNGYSPDNYFSGMKLTDKGGKKKYAFTVEEMKIILDTLDKRYGNGEIEDHHYWGGILVVYTGARLNEIASLYKEDIIEVDGIPAISINKNKNDKQLKNAASVRVIPLHSEILKRGFKEFVASVKHERLFPKLSLSAKEGYGRNLGRWYNNSFLLIVGAKKDKSKSFHSFRHAFSTCLQRAGVAQDRLMALMGHAPLTVLQKNYAEGYAMRELKEHIEKLEYTR